MLKNDEICSIVLQMLFFFLRLFFFFLETANRCLQMNVKKVSVDLALNPIRKSAIYFQNPESDIVLVEQKILNWTKSLKKHHLKLD